MVLNTIAHQIGKLRDKIALQTLAIDSIQPVVVDGVGAKFHTPDIETLYRVRELRNEQRIIQHILREIEENDVVWDIGANIGTHSLLFASAGASVVAFEPNDSTIKRLKENIELNQADVSVIEAALSNETSTGSLKSSGGAASGTHHVSTSGNDISLIKAEDLEKPQPDIVKIDVEGHEIQVLEGFNTLLSELKYIIVEVHEGVDVSEIEELLSSHGLEVTPLDIDGRGEKYLEGRENKHELS